MTRSPPGKYSSNPNLSTGSDIENTRKRKQPDCELTQSFKDFTLAIQSSLEDFKADLDTKILKIDDSIKNIRSDLETLNTTSVEIKNELTSLRNEQVHIKQEVFQLGNKHENLEKVVVDVQSSLELNSGLINDLKDRVQSIEKKSKSTDTYDASLSFLQAKIESLEQQARSCNLEINGIPEKRNENLLEIMIKIGQIIEYPIGKTEVLAIHRVPQPQQQNDRPKNIIIKVASRIMRDNILSAFRKAKGINTSQIGISGVPKTIYMNEHLTLEKKRLFRKCREAARGENYQYVWVKNATILVRESSNHAAFAIHSEKDIDRIKAGRSKKIDNTQKT